MINISNNNDYSTSFFYNGFRKNNVGDSLPPQMIPMNRKDSDWQESNMDVLESIGIKQLKENLKFNDFYKMVKGELIYSDYLDIPPQLRDVQRVREQFDIPTFLKHYDLIGIIVNALTGEYMNNTDKFVVANTDEFASNEYERTKNGLLMDYVKEELDKELKITMIRQGIDVDKKQFSSQQEQLDFIQQIQQTKNALTPPEIETHMKTKWSTKATKWGEHTLENDRERFYMDEMTRNEFRDYLLTGRCFRHHFVGYDYYRPESWSPINTFFSKDVDTKYVQKGEYVGRVHFYTSSQVVNKWGHKLSEADKKRLTGADNYRGGQSSDLYKSGSMENAAKHNFNQRVIAPHEQFLDHEFLNNLQDELGVPLATTTVKDKYGKDVDMPAYLPSRNNFSPTGGNNYLAQAIRDGLNLRNDLLQVTEGYWMGYKRIGYISYRTKSGRFAREIVTEDLLKDFLRENGIKQLTVASLEQVEANPEKYENSIVWDYVPETYYGIKINPSNGYLDKPIYLGMEPTDFQIKGDSLVYDVQLPVSGYVGDSLGMRIKSQQIGFNISMNQLANIMEKEVGLFWIFDINFLPSEFKDFGDTEETLMHMREIARDIGLFAVDGKKQNTNGAQFGNQMTPINLSLSSQIADRISLSQFYKNQAFELVGITPGRLATPTKHETAEGVRQNADASYAQTEIYFSQFSDYLKRTYDIHLNVAQYAQKSGKDISVFYKKSDNTQAFLKFQDEDFPNRHLGVIPISNSKKRKELETFKRYLLQNNTLTSDTLSFATLLTSDSIVELIEVAREERLRAQEDADNLHNRQLEVLSKEAELEEQAKQSDFDREEASKDKDRQNKLDVERIESLGRAVDNEADPRRLDFINKSADLAIKNVSANHNMRLENRKLDMEDKDKMEKRRIEMSKLNLQAKELKERAEQRKSEEFVATINKN